MIDPIINLDPFNPPARARQCPHCQPGRLFVEVLGDRRRVWCDECSYSQVFVETGPMAKVVMREVDSSNRRPGGMPKKIKDPAP